MARARNIISRTRELSDRAADLFDGGDVTYVEAAEELSQVAGKKISARTVMSWYKRDYEPFLEERRRRTDAAERVRAIFAGAQNAGVEFAEAGQELLARMFYEILEGGGDVEVSDLAKVGRTLAKVREIDLAEQRLQLERLKAEQARQLDTVVEDTALTPEEKAAKMKNILGLPE